MSSGPRYQHLAPGPCLLSSARLLRAGLGGYVFSEMPMQGQQRRGTDESLPVRRPT